MKTIADNGEQFLTNAKGKRTAVLLDLRTYQRLREAEEELAEIRAYDHSRKRVRSEIAAGQFSTLAAYRGGRERRAK